MASAVKQEARSALVRFCPSIDRSRAIYAFKVVLAAVLTLFLAFLVDLPPAYWALMTIAQIVQVEAGLTAWRALMVVFGTIVGGLVGLSIIASFAQNSALAVTALALFLLATGTFARFERGLDAYAYGIAGMTALIVVMVASSNAGQAFNIAVTRITEVLIAVGSICLVHLVVFPRSVEKTMRESMRKARAAVVERASKAASGDTERWLEGMQAATKSVVATHTNIGALGYERHPLLRSSLRKSGEVVHQLTGTLVAAEALAELLGSQAQASGSRTADIIEGLPDIFQLHLDVPDTAAQARAAAESMDEAVRGIDRRLNALDPAAEDAWMTMRALRQLASSLAALSRAEADLLDPEAPAPRQRATPRVFRDWSAAVQRGLRPAIIIVTLATLYFASASPSLLIPTLVTASTALMIPTIAPRPALPMIGLGLGLGFVSMYPAALALQIVLPHVESFVALAAILSGVIFFYFYFSSGPDPSRAAYGTACIIIIGITLQPTNEQSYDTLRFLNYALSIGIVPIGMTIAFNVLFPENQAWLRRHLERGARRVLRARADKSTSERIVPAALEMISDYGGDVDLSDTAGHRSLRLAYHLLVARSELEHLRRISDTKRLPPELNPLFSRAGSIVAADSPVGSELKGMASNVQLWAQAVAADPDTPAKTKDDAWRSLFAFRFLAGHADRAAPITERQPDAA